MANGVRNPSLTPATTSAPVAVPDLRSFCVVVRHLRGQPELGVNRLELVASPPHIGAFWPFRRRVEKVVCSRRRFGVQRDNTTCRFAGVFTGATGLEPATSGVTGRYGRYRHKGLRPGITGQSRHFVPERTGCDRLRAVIARQSLCSTCVVELLSDQATASSGTVTSSFHVSGRHARTCAIIRDKVSAANRRDPESRDASRDVARVVSAVSVLCPAQC